MIQQKQRILINRIYFKFLYFLMSDSLWISQFWCIRGVHNGEGTHVFKNVKFGRGGKDPIAVGKNCVLTGCTILGHDASTNRAMGIRRSMIQPVHIQDDCFIGHGSIVLMGVTVGKGSIVGAGAVVTSDVTAGNVVASNPARVICTVDELVARRKQLALDHPEFFP